MKGPTKLTRYLSSLSPNRQLLGHLLMDKNWFKNTDFDLQKQVLTLPDNFEGYVYDLTERSDTLGNLDLLKLSKIVIGEYLITSVFSVYSRTKKKTFLQEYVSWCHGRHPGIKGLILVNTDGRISHFVTTKTEKFPTGRITFDSVGGLTQYSPTEITSLSRQVEQALKNKLNLDSVIIKEIYDLGHLESDNGLTPNHPGIFAVVIDGPSIKKSIDQTHPGSPNKSPQVEIVPISKLPEYLSKVDDAFFLAIIARLLAKGVLSLS